MNFTEVIDTAPSRSAFVGYNPRHRPGAVTIAGISRKRSVGRRPAPHARHRTAVGDKGEGQESTGHRSGRRIEQLLRTRKVDLTDDDAGHMRKVVATYTGISARDLPAISATAPGATR